MRILFFTHTFTPDYTGGAEVSLYHTCRGLLARGVDAMILAVTTHGAKPTDEWYEVDGIPVHRIQLAQKLRSPSAELFSPQAFWAVRRALQQLQPDIFHTHNVAHATLAPLVASWATRTPTVATLHDQWLLCPNNMLYQADGTVCDPAAHPNGCGNCFRRYEYWGSRADRRRWTLRATRHVAHFISPSQALIDLHVAGGFDRSRFRLVPYALTQPTWGDPTHPGVLEVLAQADARPTLAFAGGGVVIKGAEVMLRAIPTLLEAIPDVQLAIAGTGDAQYFQEYARYAPDVKVLGMVPFLDMRALFAGADLSLVPSVWPENSPVVIYENFQVGTPVVGSAIGGIPELIEPNKTGYLFAPNHAEEMVARVVEHMQRPAHERRRMRQACVAAARARWTLTRHLDLLEAVYADLLGAPHPSRLDPEMA
jgi:glycosyltransferase involved in cell wall biosynthesis